jgi:DNA topoisomerase IB
VARLKRVDCSSPGCTRLPRGRGFEYLDAGGLRITDETELERIRALAIPPAWREVWISAHPMGHIQATGIDVAGRKQYRYHDAWREHRDREKFDSMLEFAAALPRLRRRVAKDLRRDDLSRERVLACATRLLDRGFFRIGSESYAEENDTYGLATIRKEQVTVNHEDAVFDYSAKGGKRRVQRISDPELQPLLRTLRRRRSGGSELLAYKDGRAWRDVRSTDVNEYVREAAGDEDFRTWNATVLAAIAVAVSGTAASGSKTARRRAVKRAVDEVAHHLGNTPTVARASYIDPRVFDRFDGGLTIGGVLPDLASSASEGEGWPLVQRSVETAVIDLIAGSEGSEALERVA